MCYCVELTFNTIWFLLKKKTCISYARNQRAIPNKCLSPRKWIVIHHSHYFFGFVCQIRQGIRPLRTQFNPEQHRLWPNKSQFLSGMMIFNKKYFLFLVSLWNWIQTVLCNISLSFLSFVVDDYYGQRL